LGGLCPRLGHQHRHSQPTSAPKETSSTINVSTATIMVAHPGEDGPGWGHLGEWLQSRDRALWGRAAIRYNSRVNNAILAATRRARTFERAEAINPFSSPPPWRAALREYQERQPPRPPGKVVAIHTSTDGAAVLRRVFSQPSEDDRRRAVEAARKRRWRAARSSEQVAAYRSRDREAARRRRSAPSAG
jgi:hypothetical protein